LTAGRSQPILTACRSPSWPTSSPATDPCGRLTGDATEPEANGYLLTVGCSCGVAFLRWVTLEEAARELVMSHLATSMS
jgi:hypothetical protein